MSKLFSSQLTEEIIARRIREAPSGPNLTAMAAVNMDMRPAAVLVPLVLEDDQWSLLFTRRTETVQSHKGQVSFPGGAMDAVDNTPEATALRETLEEIGLKPDDVTLLGRLAVRPTITRFLVTPVVGRLRCPCHFLLSQHEVSRVFTIPLNWLADPANHEERLFNSPLGLFEHVIYFQPYDGEILWGITARITLDLISALHIDALR